MLRLAFLIYFALTTFIVCLASTESSAQAVSRSQTTEGDIVLVSLSKPIYPPMARQARIAGDVNVTVTLRPDGMVESAVIVSGHPILRQAALDSALQSRFECRMCSQATISYSLLYTFEIISGDDCCNAFGVAPKVEQEAQSRNPQGLSQTHVVVRSEGVCICDPAADRTKKRSPKCLYLWKCSFSD
jgi:TonB family protein